jgi:hypothetical protein
LSSVLALSTILSSTVYDSGNAVGPASEHPTTATVAANASPIILIGQPSFERDWSTRVEVP